MKTFVIFFSVCENWVKKFVVSRRKCNYFSLAFFVNPRRRCMPLTLTLWLWSWSVSLRHDSSSVVETNFAANLAVNGLMTRS